MIDASGLALAPGFIDVHTHDDFALLLRPDMDFKILGGVTTVVVGNCGLGAAPYPMASIMADTATGEPRKCDTLMVRAPNAAAIA